MRGSLTTGPATGPSLWLLVGIFAVAHGANVTTPLLVLYQDRLDLGDAATMSIFGVYLGGILAALLVAGPLSDRIGRRPVCVPMFFLSAGASLVLVLGRDEFLLLLLGRALLGLASGAFLGVGAAWAQELFAARPDSAGQELRGATIITLTTFVGFGSGPLWSAIFERLFDAPLVVPLLVHVGLILVVAIGVARVPETRRRAASGRRPASIESPVAASVQSPPALVPPRPTLRPDLRLAPADRRRFFFVLAPTAIWAFGFPANSFALFPVLLREAMEGFEVTVAGASGALTAWSAVLSRPVTARMSPHRAAPTGLAAGVAGLTLGAIGFAADVWPLLLPASVLLGTGSGVLMTSGLAITTEIAQDERQGALTTAFYAFAYLGMLVPMAVTTIGRVWSSSAGLIIVTTAAGLTGLVLTMTVREPPRPAIST